VRDIDKERAMADGVTPKPHRGVLILVFGIVGLVMCMPLGIAAWIMGNGELASMDRGELDPSGRGMTQAGKILGIISVVWFVVGLMFAGMILAGVFVTATHH
jgi:hypothetical protein